MTVNYLRTSSNIISRKKILVLIYPFTNHHGYGSTEGQETLKTKSKEGTNTMVNMSTRGDMQRGVNMKETQ